MATFKAMSCMGNTDSYASLYHSSHMAFYDQPDARCTHAYVCSQSQDMAVCLLLPVPEALSLADDMATDEVIRLQRSLTGWGNNWGSLAYSEKDQWHLNPVSTKAIYLLLMHKSQEGRFWACEEGKEGRVWVSPFWVLSYPLNSRRGHERLWFQPPTTLHRIKNNVTQRIIRLLCCCGNYMSAKGLTVKSMGPVSLL